MRRALLAELTSLSPEEIGARMEDGLPKLWLIRQALHLRRTRPELFGPKGSYRPLFATGPKADHVVAFIRGEGAISMAPRLVMGLSDGWAETVLELPTGHWHDILTGNEHAAGTVRLAQMLNRFPVALLVRKE